MLTAATAIGDRVEGLNLGADDSLSTPTRTPDQLEDMASRVKRSVARAEATVEALLTLAASEVGPQPKKRSILQPPRRTNLPEVMGTHILSGRFLGAVANRYPEVVLGNLAAQVLQITHADGGVLVYLGNTWFTVVGTMSSATLDTSLDSDVFMSLPVAERMFKVQPNPSTIYVRANQNDVNIVANLLAATADPQDASGVQVSRPSDALEARAAAKGQFTTLLVGLGAVALLVGAIGIANIMVISVLERRGEIGLRRALGATRRHIATQFLTESALLAAIGGIAFLILGAGATAIYAQTKHEPFIVPLYALIAAPTAGFLIGAIAGLYPAMKAARLSPTEALRAT